MEEKIRYKIPFIDLLCHEMIKGYEHYIEFHPKHLRWVYDGLAKVRSNPQSDDWEDEHVQFTWDILRKCLLTVELKYITDLEVYKVEAVVWGSKEDLKLYFKNEQNATAMRDMILDYMLRKRF